MKIIVASTNPVKIRAVENTFAQVFPEKTFELQGAKVSSGISDQPMSDAETRQGAINRARNASDAEPKADYWVGLEGGIAEIEKSFLALGWVCVKSLEQEGLGRTSGFFLPEKVNQLIRQGYELGEADDIVFKRENSKQGNGSVGILTKDIIIRETLFHEAIVHALIPFMHPELY